MTPLEQTRLPWAVRGDGEAMRGIAEAIGRLESCLERGRPAAMLENEDMEGGIVTLGVLLPPDDKHLRELRIMVPIHIDVLQHHAPLDGPMPPARVVQHVLRICRALAASSRTTSWIDPDREEVTLAILDFAQARGLTSCDAPHFGYLTAATPLGTGGLVLDVEDGWAIHPSDEWRIPGPVEVEIHGPMPTDQHGTRDEMRIAAYDIMQEASDLDPLQRLRIQARIAARRSGEGA